MISLNTSVKDKSGKTISIERLAFYLQVSSKALLNCFYGKGGWGLQSAMIFSKILLEKGYDFPASTFLNEKTFNLLSKFVEQETGCKIQRYNPIT